MPEDKEGKYADRTSLIILVIVLFHKSHKYTASDMPEKHLNKNTLSKCQRKGFSQTLHIVTISQPPLRMPHLNICILRKKVTEFC